jgi:hypothetical protein
MYLPSPKMNYSPLQILISNTSIAIQVVKLQCLKIHDMN